MCCVQSCNLLRVVDNHQHRKFDRKGIDPYTFKSDSGTHHVQYCGNGKPKLMLLHGYGASGVGQYYRTALALRNEYDLILPDLLYCGRSSGDSLDFSIQAQVQHIKLMLDSLHIAEPIAVLGNSYGGVVAAFFAEKYPELVNKLVIYDSPVCCYTSAYADSLAHTLGVESVRNLLSPLDVRENKISLDLVFHDQPYIPTFLRKQMVKYGSKPAAPVQVKLLEWLIENEDELNTHIFSWQCPVYVVWGEFDILIPTTTRDALVSRYNIPPARVCTFSNAAHAANVEFPDQFVVYLKTIMNEN
ncbi:MAG: alpha/beta fold hydrolase [Flavobacteriales bacterium]